MAELSRKARAIAYYLPQFHPIPENDEWWGLGFTEWTNVAKAKPMFPGHHQPNVPADLGFYDLRVPETRVAQAEMAREYGVEGFCYWHYWFAGKRLLDRPFNEVLESGEPDFPFCLGWANQTWSGIWHGEPNRVLIEQTYPGLEDYSEHFRCVLRAFMDKRYITVDGKPMFVVYCPQLISNPREFTDCWREMADKAGLKGLHFVAVIRKHWDLEEHGFDASITGNLYSTNVAPHPAWTLLNKILNRTVRRLRGAVSPWPLVYDYKSIVKRAFEFEPDRPNHYPVVVPNWDNTPRSGKRGVVLKNSSPKLFQVYLRKAIERVSVLAPEHRIIFLKSWNEWAEGNYLEPDIRYGRAYLEALKQEIEV
ncbi:MAG: glycosyltransferase WbsX family protein [Armatimonadota bacterium]